MKGGKGSGNFGHGGRPGQQGGSGGEIHGKHDYETRMRINESILGTVQMHQPYVQAKVAQKEAAKASKLADKKDTVETHLAASNAHMTAGEHMFNLGNKDIANEHISKAKTHIGKQQLLQNAKIKTK